MLNLVLGFSIFYLVSCVLMLLILVVLLLNEMFVEGKNIIVLCMEFKY